MNTIRNVLEMKSRVLQMLPLIVLLLLIASERASAAEGSGGGSFKWYSLIEPLGISTLSCLLLTFLAGLFRRKLGRRFKKVHLTLAAITVALALSHGLLVLIVYG